MFAIIHYNSHFSYQKEQYYLPKEHRRKNIIIFILLKNKSKKPIQLRSYMAQTYLGKRENKPYWS